MVRNNEIPSHQNAVSDAFLNIPIKTWGSDVFFSRNGRVGVPSTTVVALR
jgi:hypothetical protein